MTDSPAIDALDLRRTFHEVVAVDGVTLEVERGAVFGLVGPDGAGKSTLIRLLATVLEPTSGDASIFGHSVTRDAQAVKSRIGYMSQRFSLYGDLTVAENLAFFAELRGVPRVERTERAKKLLEFSGLTEFSKRQARNLSGGMKQKLALAATLIHEPDLLFLDEPTTGVDPVSRREFWRIISGLHRRGITVLVATPYMDEAERCTEVAFMDAGRIVLRDTPAGIKRRVPGRLVEITVDDNRRAATLLATMDHVTGVEPYGDVLYVLVDCEQPCEEDLAKGLADAGLAVARISPAAMTMEVAFSRLISGSSVAPVTGGAT
ncbi:MAG: ABC transporter ATP-binding protein [Coriobacteriia bacterium]